MLSSRGITHCLGNRNMHVYAPHALSRDPRFVLTQMTVTTKMTTMQNHHHHSEAHFDSSPGEGKGHKPAGTPAREGKSYIGKDVPTKPFEGEPKAASTRVVMESNAVVNKPKSGKPDTVVYCPQEGVNILVPFHKKNFIPALDWAVKDPTFWTLVLDGKGLPIPRDRLEALEEHWFQRSVIPPLTVLKERETLPESPPSRQWTMSQLRAKIRSFWPKADPTYPKVKGKHLTPRQVSLLQRAVKTDVFYLLLSNPLIWVPLKTSQVKFLTIEFTSEGKMLNSLPMYYRFEPPIGCADEVIDASQDKENIDEKDAGRRMTALKEVGSSKVQDAGRKKTAAKDSGFSRSQKEPVIESVLRSAPKRKGTIPEMSKSDLSCSRQENKTKDAKNNVQDAGRRMTALKEVGSPEVQDAGRRMTALKEVGYSKVQDAGRKKTAVKDSGFSRSQKEPVIEFVLRSAPKRKGTIPEMSKPDLSCSRQENKMIASPFSNQPYNDIPSCENGNADLSEHKPKSKLALSFEAFKDSFKRPGKEDNSRTPVETTVCKSLYSEKDSDKMKKTKENTSQPAGESSREKGKWKGFEKLKSFLSKPKSTRAQEKQVETKPAPKISIEADWFKKTGGGDCNPHRKSKLAKLHIPTIREWKEKRMAKRREKQAAGCIDTYRKNDSNPLTAAQGDKKKTFLKCWLDNRKSRKQLKSNKGCNSLPSTKKKVEPEKKFDSILGGRASKVQETNHMRPPWKAPEQRDRKLASPLEKGSDKKPNVLHRLKNALCSMFTFRKRKQQEGSEEAEQEIDDDPDDEPDNRNFTIRRR